MEFVNIKNTDLNVSRIGLGTWAMGGWLWGGSDKKDCIRTVYRAYDKGINLIDTAPVYGFGNSEEIVGEAVREINSRDNIVIATKAGLEWRGENVYRNSTRERILKEVDDSLKRLKTDYIDIYQIHWPDPLVPIEETAEAMSYLLKDGKIRAVGVSNYSPDQMDSFLEICKLNTNQPPYNLFERGIDDDVIPYSTENGITLLLYGALCRGLLSGKLKADSEFRGDDIRNVDPKFQKPVYQRYLDTVKKLDDFSNERFGRNVLHLSVRWILDKCKDDVTLWGARRPGQMDDVSKSVDWKIDDASMTEIEKIVDEMIPEPIGPEFMAPGPRPQD